MLECVVNISEGRDHALIADIAATCGDDLLDVHSDPDHHRSVFTLVGEDPPRRLASRAVELLDLSHHDGVHPRLGVVDVVPFVPLAGATAADALAARDRFATWAAETLGVPCFLYGPERTLPDVRRHAFRDGAPDTGPATPHPTAGACAVGSRPVLVAYNLWLAEPDIETARRVARDLRGPEVRALGLAVGSQVQVSMNLVAPDVVGPADVYDKVAAEVPVARAELVGLIPSAVLERIPSERWEQLDIDDDRTIEARLARRASGQR